MKTSLEEPNEGRREVGIGGRVYQNANTGHPCQLLKNHAFPEGCLDVNGMSLDEKSLENLEHRGNRIVLATIIRRDHGRRWESAGRQVNSDHLNHPILPIMLARDINAWFKHSSFWRDDKWFDEQCMLEADTRHCFFYFFYFSAPLVKWNCISWNVKVFDFFKGNRIWGEKAD